MDRYSAFLGSMAAPSRAEGRSWPVEVVWLHVIADAAIVVAYLAIPIAVAIIAGKRADIRHLWLLALFGASIGAMGFLHVLDIASFWTPMPLAAGLAKSVTALVSLGAAIALIGALSGILAMPDMREQNEKYELKINECEQLQRDLMRTRDELETRSAEMTRQARRFTYALSAAEAVACCWEAESGKIDWQIGFGESARRAGVGTSNGFERWTDLLPEAGCAELLGRSSACVRGDRAEVMVYSGPVIGGGNVLIRLAASAAEPSGDGRCQMIGMFRFAESEGASGAGAL